LFCIIFDEIQFLIATAPMAMYLVLQVKRASFSDSNESSVLKYLEHRNPNICGIWRMDAMKGKILLAIRVRPVGMCRRNVLVEIGFLQKHFTA
jgi:hypothetical protein